MTEQEPKEQGREEEEQAPKLASKEEVIEASRRRYGMPRVEVERWIAKQMGYRAPEEQQQQHRDRLCQRLQREGVTERQAKYLLAEYSLDRIQQQLDWLPFRGAHNPAAFIVAAVRHNYDPPERLYVDSGSSTQREDQNRSETSEQKPNPEYKPRSE